MKPCHKNKKSLYVLLTMILFLFSGFSDHNKASNAITSYHGAWRLADKNQETIKIITSNHFSYATYNLKDKKFKSAGGGTWKLVENKYIETLEYFTEDPTKVGSSLAFISKMKGSEWVVADHSVNKTWTKVDDSSKSPLSGTWRITQRATAEGEKISMPKGARKTLKFLSDNYFQWAAINPETKEFFGTGGGKYSLKDGKYSEHIQFFSRDSSRVGLQLTFDYEVNGNEWHHSGHSTTGNVVDEIWTRED